MNTTSPSRRYLLAGACCAAAGVLAAPAVLRAATPDKPRVRVGQIGTTHAHASKLAVYRKSADYEVVGVVEPDPARRAAAERSATFRDVRWMTEDELLNASGLQAVLVETPVKDLLATAARCVAAGKHVHLDKPAGESLPAFRQLLADAERRKLLVQMGYMLRYNPGVILLRKFLREGWLGDVFEVHAVMSKVVGAAERKSLAAYPGGMMFELGCHVIDLVVSVLGPPQQVHPFARHSADTKADVLADNMLAVFEYPRATATVRATALEVDGAARRHLVSCGTGGTFQILPLEPPAVRYSLAKAAGEYAKGTHDLALDHHERYAGDAADMAAILRGEKASDYPYAHDLAVQEAVLRASGVAIEG